MACCLTGNKPLHEPVMTYHLEDPHQYIHGRFIWVSPAFQSLNITEIFVSRKPDSVAKPQQVVSFAAERRPWQMYLTHARRISIHRYDFKIISSCDIKSVTHSGINNICYWWINIFLWIKSGNIMTMYLNILHFQVQDGNCWIYWNICWYRMLSYSLRK